MRAVWLSFFQMLGALRRDKMLFAALFVPVLAGGFLQFGVPVLETVLTRYFHRAAVLSPYEPLIDLLLALLAPTMFCFVSAMCALEEADERTAAYLFVTPLGKGGYLAARFGVPAAAAFLATAILLPVCGRTPLSCPEVLLLAAGGVLQGLIVALLIVTLSSNKLEGMAVAKLSSLLLLDAAGPFLIRGRAQYALSLLPSFWAGKAVCTGRLLCYLPAFAGSAAWIGALFRRYLRKI